MGSGFIETGLPDEALQIHRALASLQEELEAIDYYHQRIGASDDPALKAVLTHNRDDEMEHASMLLEWLRRAMPELDVQLRKFLFSSGPITPPASGAKPPAAKGQGLGLGTLK